MITIIGRSRVKRRDTRNLSCLASRKRARGFTLPEMLVTMFISGIVMTALTSSLMTLIRGNYRLANYADMSAQGRRAVAIFTNDVREGAELVSLASNRFVMQIPLGQGRSKRITYRYDAEAGRLNRVENGVPRKLMDGIEQFTFTYFDTQNRATMNSLTAKKVQMSADLTRGSGMVSSENHAVSARVTMRNKATGN